MDLNVNEPAIMITGSLHVETKLLFSAAHKLHGPASRFFTVNRSWAFCPNKYAISTFTADIESGFVLALKSSSSNFTLLGMIFWKF
jgi:hypothetical protein